MGVLSSSIERESSPGYEKPIVSLFQEILSLYQEVSLLYSRRN